MESSNVPAQTVDIREWAGDFERREMKFMEVVRAKVAKKIAKAMNTPLKTDSFTVTIKEETLRPVLMDCGLLTNDLLKIIHRHTKKDNLGIKGAHAVVPNTSTRHGSGVSTIRYVEFEVFIRPQLEDAPESLAHVARANRRIYC